MYLIVGATGSLGGRVAMELLARGEPVRALVRAASPMRQVGRYTDPAELRARGAEIVEGDLKRPETIEPHLRGVKAVLFTASGTKRMPPDTIEAVDHEGAAALAAAARRAGVEHLVYLSARGAGPDAPPFLRPKWQAENSIREDGPPATFVRPALYMQDWIGFVLGAQLQGGSQVQLVGERDPLKSFVDEGDVAKLLTALLLEGPPPADDPAKQLDFAADVATYGEIVRRMAAGSGLPLTIERIPAGQPLTTMSGPAATTVTELLTVASFMPEDTLLTPQVSERYGIAARSIDDFLEEMFAAVPS